MFNAVGQIVVTGDDETFERFAEFLKTSDDPVAVKVRNGCAEAGTDIEWDTAVGDYLTQVHGWEQGALIPDLKGELRRFRANTQIEAYDDFFKGKAPVEEHNYLADFGFNVSTYWQDWGYPDAAWKH